uniref:Protein kinase domain-containing protein n=1 Tax=Oryza punctata TaxID=4537 RepID=A0A0E0LU02_ORYPU
MQNGNLDTWLHHRYASKAPKGLSLSQRIHIAANTADALAYLHHDSGSSIVHCDMKPSNIMLDADMNAYLGDFGIPNLVFNSGSTSVGRAVPDSDTPIGVCSMWQCINLWGCLQFWNTTYGDANRQTTNRQ